MDSPQFTVQVKIADADYTDGDKWEDCSWPPTVNGLKQARTQFPFETYRVVMVVDENMESHLG